MSELHGVLESLEWESTFFARPSAIVRLREDAPALQEADFSAWQRAQVGDRDDAESLAAREIRHWRARLADLPERLELPTDRPHPTQASGEGGKLGFAWGAADLPGFDEAVRALETTPAIAGMTGLGLALDGLGAGSDIPLGFAVAGRDDERLGRAGRPGDRSAVVAWNAVQEATVVTIPAETVTTGATSVRVEGIDGKGDEATATHLLVRAEHHAEAVVVIDHTGDALLTETVEIEVGDGAHLTVVSVQDWSAGAVHASSHRARLGRDAKLKHVVVTFGGDVVRITPDAALTHVVRAVAAGIAAGAQPRLSTPIDSTA